MRGNAAILKCTIPSFVADFVHVEAWIDEDGKEYMPSSEGNLRGTKNITFNTVVLHDSCSILLLIYCVFFNKSIFFYDQWSISFMMQR